MLMRAWMTVLCVAGMSAAVGCTGSAGPRARSQLNAGIASYNSGDCRDTVRQMDAFLQSSARTREADQAYYMRGLARYELAGSDRRQLQAARSDLQEALSRSGSKELSSKAALTLGDVTFDLADMSMAQDMYSSSLERLDAQSPHRAHALYRLGCVLQRQGQWQQADKQFQAVQFEFPASPEAARAGVLVNSRAWTVQAGSFCDSPSAKAAVNRLAGKKLPASSTAVQIEGSLRYVVQVGRYPRFEDAAAMCNQVRTYQSDAFISPSR